jgi:hypothetical protein
VRSETVMIIILEPFLQAPGAARFFSEAGEETTTMRKCE